MSAEAWLGAALGALLALDHAACVSILVSRPLLAAALFGLASGRFEAAVAAGALVQMVWMVPLPVGGARLPEAWLGGAVAAVAAPEALPRDWIGATSLLPPVVAGVVAALAAAPLVWLQRRWQSSRAAAVVARVHAGDLAAIERAQGSALALHALRGAVLGALAVVFGARFAAALAAPLAGVAAGWLVLPLAVIALGRNAAAPRLPWWLCGAAVGAACAWLGDRA